MKNYEKYKDEIREYKGQNFCTEFIKKHIFKKEDSCGGVDCIRCNMLQIIWLLEDYEEPEIDWSKVEVDTVILVKAAEHGDWFKRHFAEYKNGKVYTWDNGRISYETSCMTSWKYAKLIED